MPQLDLHRTYRNLGRYRQVVGVLIKYGFGEVLDRMNIAGFLRIGSRKLFARQQELAAYSWAERIRLALEELGPTFVKIGQILSTRPFLIPPELALELTKLQDQVTGFAYTEVVQIVEKELGKPLTEVFLKFEETACASASLSQVHRATTIAGDVVAVKVQRPNVQEVMEKDLSILRDLAGLLERYVPETKAFDPVAIVDEVWKSAKQETDFTFEARNLEIFARNFADDERLVLPEVYWDLTTSKVLTLSYIDGIKISDKERILAAGIDPVELTRVGGEIAAKQIFEHGYFHADPHPGNLFALPGNRIALVDFGMMGRLSRGSMELISDLLIAASSDDTRRLVRVFQSHELLSDNIRPAALETELSLFLHRYHGVQLSKLNMRSMITEAFRIVTTHNIKFPPELMMLGKTLGTYEELARALNPQYEFITALMPAIQKLSTRKFSPRNIMSELGQYLGEMRDLVLDLPFEFKRITRNLRNGELSISLQHKGLERLIVELEKASNRIAFSMIIAAIIVGSSLVMTRDSGMMIYGFPVLGLVGFITAGILGIWLVIAILRSGKL
ncbi:MAG: AarF/ABC1/UbiB kinase family protein [bacterium]|nr:AarF/ABC1/UbiB kinase family protein [bacterium]